MHFELLCIMHFKVTRKLFISNHIIIRYNAAVKMEQKVHEYKRFDKIFLFCTNMLNTNLQSLIAPNSALKLEKRCNFESAKKTLFASSKLAKNQFLHQK